MKNKQNAPKFWDMFLKLFLNEIWICLQILNFGLQATSLTEDFQNHIDLKSFLQIFLDLNLFWKFVQMKTLQIKFCKYAAILRK